MSANFATARVSWRPLWNA